MKIHQTSNKVSERRWEWSISLDASQEELDAIEKVIYYLHPTFRNSVVERTNRSENFEFSTSGWGTFVIRIEIHSQDGRVEERRHRLVFDHGKSKVFLAYSESQTDPEIVEAVRSKASQLGWDVTSSEAIKLDEDWSSALSKQVEEAQLLVMIGGDTPSRYVMEEVEVAKQLGKKVLAYDASNHYGLSGSQQVASSNELLDAFKAYDYELKGS